MVTIIGGGIAGMVLAGSLARHDHPVTVYERQSPTGTGAFMALDGHAQDVLAEHDVSPDDLTAASHRIHGFRFHYLPDKNYVRARGHRLYRRADLMRVLTQFASATKAHIHYDMPVTDIDPRSGTLYSGTEILPSSDLLIAADGIDSIVRARIEPDRTPEYADQIVIYGTIDHTLDLPTEPEVLHFHGQLGTGFLPTTTFGHLWNDTATFWFARLTQPPIPTSDIGFHPVPAWSDTVRAAAPDAPDLVNTLLEATETLHVSNARNVPLTHAAPPQPRVILCGDADHAITPAAARGAREAIDDAAAIHHAIQSGDSVAEAMTHRRQQIVAEREEAQRTYTRTRS
ncbi:NAD(P)/FAD-dependent oxidoreductase [Nocardia sp. CDC153]|uniref:FAD-dependent oxidoreductase n=1 Tax=Nocardia sp. CDC153 TaxID=3112167 RepID=UPI002DBB421F|nr:NAD(P)/FAD-dependent oxidoreductase [Nocardia sp. CDC153]MEC3952770.1 NAD(P)/FAD-dependent oxidoreductase [Nocardia sp. CDC153]